MHASGRALRESHSERVSLESWLLSSFIRSLLRVRVALARNDREEEELRGQSLGPEQGRTVGRIEQPAVRTTRSNQKTGA